ncbi:MAG: D-glycerate dehydrogenase [Rhodospirillaceae bacterium]|nr:D-glycerate dehydrogenase [Rhodospirillaceae bacterium]
MPLPLVAVTRRLPAACETRLDALFRVRWGDDATDYDAARMLALAEGADALLVSAGDPVPAAVIAKLPASVKVISTFSVGTDHIDIKAAKARGIYVGNTPGVLTDATADIALLLMLAAMRRAGEGERLVRAGKWTGWRPTQLMGTHLSGKTLGIVGLGRIGAATARRAKAFGMNIAYHSRRPVPEAETLQARYFANLDDMLPQVQVLSLHCPLTPETKGLVNARRLALLPKGAIVINTARGGSVIDEDLIAALTSGHIAAAGLDVYANEPNLHPGYLNLENAVLLPHLGSATTETRAAMGLRAIENISAVLAGNPPVYGV